MLSPSINGHKRRWAWVVIGVAFCLMLAYGIRWHNKETTLNQTEHMVFWPPDHSAFQRASPTQAAQLDKRVAIVYSETSAEDFYDKKAYSQLFMAMQHQAMMAGIPFDLLREEALTDVAHIADYDALVFPWFAHVPLPLLPAIENTLHEAVYQYGIGIITAGEFMTEGENGASLPGDPYQRMKQLLGLQPVAMSWSDPVGKLLGLLQRISGAPDSLVYRLLRFLRRLSIGGPAAITVTAEDITHPIMRDYEPGEVISEYELAWFNSFDGLPDQPVAVLAKQTVAGEMCNAILATETGGRNVHFGAFELMGDSSLVWQALQWVVYGEQTAVGLNMGRNKSIFVSRCDMDKSQWPYEITTTETALYRFLAEWKNEYNFVGSFYINIGNDPDNNKYTDWDVSGPLYQKYMALGNEIGTHSYTHPFYVTNLTPEELEFEFCESKRQIEEELDIAVFGAAAPGNPENLAVTRAISHCLSYLSGSYSGTGSGFAGAFGYLTPDYRMIYLAPNLVSDYTLVEYWGWTPPQAEAYWLQQYSDLGSHASQPIIHWPWHDYGPTNGSLYVVEMYTHLIERAYNNDAEFATAADAHKRIQAFRSASLEVSDTGTGVITATVAVPEVVASLGRFSLKVHQDRSQVIQSVEGWYAYDEDAVFLSRNGGTFTIRLGEGQDTLTRITSLPMRAELISVTGDGTELEFVFKGEGKVVIYLNPPVGADLVAVGADSTVLHGNLLEMNFDDFGLHTACIAQPSSIDH